MAVVLKIDTRRRIVSTTFHGRVTSDEVLRHGQSILAHPNFNPVFADLVDFSAVSITEIDDGALQSLASGPSIFSASSPHVIIAPADIPREIATKYRDLSRTTRPNLHVVDSLQEARELLARLGYQL